MIFATLFGQLESQADACIELADIEVRLTGALPTRIDSAGASRRWIRAVWQVRHPKYPRSRSDQYSVVVDFKSNQDTTRVRYSQYVHIVIKKPSEIRVH